MSNIWSSSRDAFSYECPVCHKQITGSSFESHRMKEIEQEKKVDDEN